MNTSTNTQYCTVKFIIGWLPGAVSFTDAAKSALAAARGTDKRVIRGSYAILGASKDALIKEGMALKRTLIAIRDEYTIPEFTLRLTANNVNDGNPEKVAGSYIIESVKVEEFLSRFNEARNQYLAWGQRVASPENYERILNSDRVALDRDWEIIERKYPTPQQLADSVSCEIPKIEPFNATFTLSDVAPETAKMLREQAEARLEASINGATAELIHSFSEMVEAVAKNCGKRIRLLPQSAEYQHLRNAEVLKIDQNADGIEAGKMLVTVQPVAEKANSDKFINRGKPEYLILSSSEYNTLGPYETSENKHLTQASFENLMWLAKKIATVKSMLREEDESESVSSLAAEVESTLTQMGGSAEDITRQLKSSSYARANAKDVFEGLLDRIKTKDIEIRERAKVKRKIKMNV